MTVSRRIAKRRTFKFWPVTRWLAGWLAGWLACYADSFQLRNESPMRSLPLICLCLCLALICTLALQTPVFLGPLYKGSTVHSLLSRFRFSSAERQSVEISTLATLKLSLTVSALSSRNFTASVLPIWKIQSSGTLNTK